MAYSQKKVNELDEQPRFSTQSDDIIATLGDPSTSVTCSTHVARMLFPEGRMMGAESFEHAADLVRSGKADKLLVPGAYPMVAHFLMDERLRLVDVAMHIIPALVVTARANPQSHYRVLYYHPATTSLLSKISCLSYDHAVPVSSNEVAVQSMLENPQENAAVTNALVTRFFDLPDLQVLRTARDMAWLVFQRTGEA